MSPRQIDLPSLRESSRPHKSIEKSMHGTQRGPSAWQKNLARCGWDNQCFCRSAVSTKSRRLPRLPSGKEQRQLHCAAMCLGSPCGAPAQWLHKPRNIKEPNSLKNGWLHEVPYYKLKKPPHDDDSYLRPHHQPHPQKVIIVQYNLIR